MRQTSFFFLVTLLGVGLVASLLTDAAARDKKKADRVFEMRTYTTHPGRLDALHARFRDHTNKIFVKHGMHYFSFFVPPGVSVILWPLMIPIEIISYLSRPISLAVRLFANMLAGHTLLKVFAGFVTALGVAGILPLVFVAALTGLEFVIAFLQAYVFAILTCLYISDALHLH